MLFLRLFCEYWASVLDKDGFILRQPPALIHLPQCSIEPKGNRLVGASREVYMNTERRPQNRKGERNPFCVFYALCLDQVVKSGWAFWDCSECENRVTRDDKIEVIHSTCGDSSEVYDLPSGLDD